MSRIAGFWSHGGDSGGGLLSASLKALRHCPEWQERTVSLSGAQLGWCGSPRYVRAARRDRLMAVVDGSFFHCPGASDSTNPAENILALYEERGFAGALQCINGDFALALYDGANERLWLGRDRFGVKPLYYVNRPDYFAFASQLRALLVMPGITGELNRRAVALFAACHYRYFDNEPTQTFYREITQLPAAHCLCVGDGTTKRQRFWELEDLPDHDGSEMEMAEAYRELLLDAVRIRLRPTETAGFTLSGGMDSSSVLSCAARATGEKQHAFSTVYEDRTYDESDDIQAILPSMVKEWHRVDVSRPDVFGIVERMVEIHDEPVATATWLSHFVLCEEARAEGFTQLFGGLGGDELNAGEYEYFFYHFADLRQAGCTRALQDEIEHWIKYHDHPIFRKSSAVVDATLSRVVDSAIPGRCLPDRRRLERYASVLDPVFFDLMEFEPVMDHPFGSCLKNRTYQDIFRETVPCCLRAQDRHGAAFGVEHVMPFFDHRLVEFMFRVTGISKIRHGVTKHLLREAMRGVLPEPTRIRIKKTGWNAPAHLWFSGRGQSQLLDLIHSRSFQERGIYRVHELTRIVGEHQEIVQNQRQMENHMMFLWQVVNLELWLRKLETSRADPPTV